MHDYVSSFPLSTFVADESLGTGPCLFLPFIECLLSFRESFVFLKVFCLLSFRGHLSFCHFEGRLSGAANPGYDIYLGQRDVDTRSTPNHGYDIYLGKSKPT